MGLITWIFSSKSDAETDDLIGAFSSWVIQNIQVGYPRKQEFHIRYKKISSEMKVAPRPLIKIGTSLID